MCRINRPVSFAGKKILSGRRPHFPFRLAASSRRSGAHIGGQAYGRKTGCICTELSYYTCCVGPDIFRDRSTVECTSEAQPSFLRQYLFLHKSAVWSAVLGATSKRNRTNLPCSKYCCTCADMRWNTFDKCPDKEKIDLEN